MGGVANMKRYLLPGAVVIGIVLFLPWGLPLALPFLLGFGVAWAGLPLANALIRRFHTSPKLATALSILGVYGLLLGVAYLLVRLLLGGLDHLVNLLPSLVDELGVLAEGLKGWMYEQVEKAPDRLRGNLEGSIEELFSGGSTFAEGATTKILSLASRILLQLPDTFVFLGTAVVSSFLISSRLPFFGQWLRKKLPAAWAQRVFPLLQNLRANLGGWFKAQCKLIGITFLVLTPGFLFLRIKSGILLALAVSFVDALPMLGTGTILVPWGLVVLLQGDTPLGLGLLALYVLTSVIRSCMEPRLLGRQLGLNPLLTLMAMYAGYKLWGILGMIAAPILTITLLEFWSMTKGCNFPKG